MTVTIDKAYTQMAYMKEAKEAVKEFKVAFTDGDLRRMAEEAFDLYLGDILKADVEVFNGDYFGFTPHYQVQLFTYRFSEMFRVWFYLDEKFEVNTNTNAYTIERFERVR